MTRFVLRPEFEAGGGAVVFVVVVDDDVEVDDQMYDVRV